MAFFEIAIRVLKVAYLETVNLFPSGFIVELEASDVDIINYFVARN
jgi:hypothetical protein